MSATQWLLITLGALLAAYVLLVLALVAAGRDTQARALARFIPDCLVLLRRLLGDPRVPRRHKLLLALLLAYVISPIDLVPDVIPVVGQLDDAIVVGLALRAVLRTAGPALVEQHWPGPPDSLAFVLRLAGR
jgi:uncharacterized membrane protein YkvA (DUF1232 family)